MTTQQIALSADTYDTLELSALAFGGIGRGYYMDEYKPDATQGEEIPCCIVGHRLTQEFGEYGELLDQDAELFSPYANDAAVARILEREGRDPTVKGSTSKVTWEAYVAERNIVRLDADA